MLAVRLFLESSAVVTVTGVLCSIREQRSMWGMTISSFIRMDKLIIWGEKKHLEIQHHTGNCFFLTSLCLQLCLVSIFSHRAEINVQYENRKRGNSKTRFYHKPAPKLLL